MNIIVANAEAVADPADELIAGYRYRPKQRPCDPDLWVQVKLDKIEKILDDRDDDTRPLHVLGSTNDLVLAELQRRYPCPLPGATYIYQVDEIEVSKQLDGYHHRRQYGWKEVTYTNAIVRLRQPYVRRIQSVEHLRVLSMSFGSIVLDHDTFDELFGGHNKYDKAEDESFTYTDLPKFKLCRVRYVANLEAVRKHRNALKAYNRRTSGEFPKEVRHGIMRCIVNGGFAFDECYENRSLYRRSGWSHDTPIDFKVHDILKQLAFSQKIWPNEPYWRTRDAVSFGEYVANALQYVHTVEKQAIDDTRREEARRVTRHQDYVAARLEIEKTLPELRDPNDAEFLAQPFVPVEEFEDGSVFGKLKYTTRTHADLLFCRWLRREARALKIKLPRPAVFPLSPAQKRDQRIKAAKAKKKRLKEVKQRETQADQASAGSECPETGEMAA